jgi:hypothetical protein
MHAKGTLLACDVRMTFHKPPKGDSHPERPRRCVYVCVCTCMHMNMYIHTCTCIHTKTYIIHAGCQPGSTLLAAGTHAHVHTHMHTSHVPPSRRSRSSTKMHTSPRICMYVCIHTHAHAQAVSHVPPPRRSRSSTKMHTSPRSGMPRRGRTPRTHTIPPPRRRKLRAWFRAKYWRGYIRVYRLVYGG